MIKIAMGTLIEEQKISNHTGEQALQLSASLPLKFKDLLQKTIMAASALNRELTLRGNIREIRLVNTILSSICSLWSEVSSIINIATLETEGLLLQPQPMDINTAIYDVVDEILPKLHRNQQRLTLRLTPKACKVIADPLRLKQVLLTIFSIVSKITPQGNNLYASSEEQGDSIVIRIWGDSPVTDANSTDIRPHSRCSLESNEDKTTSSSEPAVGLALCKYLIKLHNGKMWLPGEMADKNTFVIILPSINDRLS